MPDEYPEAYEVANKLRVEYVVAVEGTVRARPKDSVNKKMKTGDIEVKYEYSNLMNIAVFITSVLCNLMLVKL